MDNLVTPTNVVTKNIRLLPGENIVWSGQPDLNLFRPTDWIAVPFGAIWLSGVIFMASTWLKIIPYEQLRNMGFVPVIFIFCFYIIGIYNLIGRFVVEYFRKKNTRFILTNKRAIATCSWLKYVEKVAS